MPKQFTAKDETGEEIVIFIEHGGFETTTLHKSNQTFATGRLPGLRTEDGRYVNRIKKGQYEIVDDTMNIPISSDDPNAP